MTEQLLRDGMGADWSVDGFESSARLMETLARLKTAEGELSEKHFWLETVINQIPDYIYAKDLEGRFLFANRVTVLDNNLEHLSQLIGKTDFDLHPFEAAASIAATEQRVIETGEPDLGIEEQSLGRRAKRWLMMSRIPLRDTLGRTIGVVGVSRDITARKAAEHLMQAQARLLEMIAQGIALNVFLEELALMLEERMDGLRVSIMVRSQEGDQLILAAAPSLPQDFQDDIRAVDVGPEAPACGFAAWTVQRVIFSDVSTDPKWASRRISAERAGIRSCWSIPIKSFQGHAIGTLTLYGREAISPEAQHNELIAIALHLARIAIERRQAEDRISFLANHDALTGLPNRLLMDIKLERTLKQAQQSGRHVALAFVDLDNFKLVNDSLGHAAGDELLRIVAARMAGMVANKGMVVRTGGDEFILFMDLSPEEAEKVTERFAAMREELSAPISLQGLRFQVTASMGIACHPQHGETAAELLINADTAMYRAKESGRDQMRVFSTEMAEKASVKLARTEELRRALREQEFVLHFQPQWNQKTQTILGAEALVRWQHPTEGLVPPSDFIPLAEEAGLITALGDWVLQEACRQAKAWQQAGLPPMVISVNVSPRQFRENNWVGQVASVLRSTGLEPCYLELEITESLIMDDMAAAVERMRALDALGVKLAIDDFGTGYSSLSALKRFPVSRLKIDRSFVADIPNDEDDMAITSAIISLAQKLGLAVIAEGVETEAQAAFLLECGCTDIQGYLFSRPLPAAAFEMFVALPKSDGSSAQR